MQFFNVFVVLMITLLLTAVDAKDVQKAEMLGFSQFVYTQR